MKRTVSVLLSLMMLLSLIVLPVNAAAKNPAGTCSVSATIKMADKDVVIKDGIITLGEYTEIEINRNSKTTDCLLFWDAPGGVKDDAVKFLNNVHFYMSWDEEHGLNIGVEAELLETPYNPCPQPDSTYKDWGFPGDEFLFQFGMAFSVLEDTGTTKKGETVYEEIIQRGISVNTETGELLIGDYGEWGYGVRHIKTNVNGYTGELTLTPYEDYIVKVNGKTVTYEISFPIENLLSEEKIKDGKPVSGSSMLFNCSTSGGSVGLYHSEGNTKTYGVAIGDYGTLQSKAACDTMTPAVGTFSDEKIPVPTHTWVRYSAGDVAATCTEPKTVAYKCTECATVHYKYEKIGDPIGHKFEDYKSDKNATCLYDGTKTAKCTRCAATETVTDIGSGGHKFTNYISDGNASCLVDGTKTAKCDRCDATNTKPDEGSVLKHSFTYYISDGNATCKKNGTETAKCDRCEETDTREAQDSMKAHTPGAEAASTTPQICTTCGEILSPALGHHYETEVINPTCTEEGYTKHRCTDDGCGDIYYTDYTSPTGHLFTHYIFNGDSTCISDGTESAICDRCNKESDTRKKADSKTSHSFTNYISDGNATCVEDGTKTVKCDLCDAIDCVFDEGSALGHSFTNYISDGNATCVEDGTKTAQCDRCEATETVPEINSATGTHTPNISKSTEKDAVRCTVCGAVIEDVKKCPSADYPDVDTTKWYHEAVDRTIELGWMQGDDFGNFMPNKAMTRAEFVMVCARIAGHDTNSLKKYAVDAEKRFYTDVKSSQWFAGAVGWAVSNGLVDGYGNGEFRPNRYITRAEMAKLFVLFFEYLNVDFEENPIVDYFSDSNTFPNWARDYIEKFRKMGLSSGSNGKYLYNASSTRAEMAMVLYRYSEMCNKTEVRL